MGLVLISTRISRQHGGQSQRVASPAAAPRQEGPTEEEFVVRGLVVTGQQQ